MDNVKAACRNVFSTLAKENESMLTALLPYIESRFERDTLEYTLTTSYKGKRVEVCQPLQKVSMALSVDDCECVHICLTEGEYVFGFVLDLDNHHGKSQTEFKRDATRLIRALAHAPNIICTSPSQKGIHLYFFFSEPIKKETFSKELVFLSLFPGVKDIRELGFFLSPLFFTKGDEMSYFGLDILTKASAFVNERISNKKRKFVMTTQDEKLSVKTVDINQYRELKNLFGLNEETKKNVVLKDTLAVLRQHGLAEGTTLNEMSFFNDEINGFVQSRRLKSGLAISFYSNREARFVATYFCKLERDEIQKEICGEDFVIYLDVIRYFLAKNELEVFIDNGKVLCSHSIYSLGKYQRLNKPRELKEQELNNLHLSCKAFARSVGALCEMSMAEFNSSIMGIASTTLRSSLIELLNMLKNNYESKKRTDERYNPFDELAAFWPNKEVRNIVKTLLKNFIHFTLLQHITGQDMMKPSFENVIPKTVTCKTLSFDGKEKRLNEVSLSSLFGTYFNKYILWLQGRTNLGKSKFYNALFTPVKDYTTFTQGRPFNDRDMRYMTEALIVRISEVRELSSEAIELMKIATGYPEIPYRMLYKESSCGLRLASCVSDCNPPTTGEGLSKDAAMSARMVFLPVPTTNFLFCIDPSDKDNPERNPDLFSILETLPCFGDVWGQCWGEICNGEIIMDFSPEVKEYVLSRSEKEMHRPLFTEVVEAFKAKGITYEEAVEANKRSNSLQKQYVTIESPTLNDFISSVVRFGNHQSASTYVKRDEIDAIKRTIEKHSLGGHVKHVGQNEIVVYRVVLLNLLYEGETNGLRSS